MVSYFNIVKDGKILMLENTDGDVIPVPIEFRKYVYSARKNNMAIRLPNDHTKTNFIRMIPIEDFIEYKKQNKTKNDINANK